MEDKLNGMDLVAGGGELTLGLTPWVTPVVYSEDRRACQALLLSRMAEGILPRAPIWGGDTSDLAGLFDAGIDIVCANLDGQDSGACNGEGMERERRNVLDQLVNLAAQIHPPFVFVVLPAGGNRLLARGAKALANIGFDTRFNTLSAAKARLPGDNERQFLLGFRQSPEWNAWFKVKRATLSRDQEAERCFECGEPRAVRGGLASLHIREGFMRLMGIERVTDSLRRAAPAEFTKNADGERLPSWAVWQDEQAMC